MPTLILGMRLLDMIKTERHHWHHWICLQGQDFKPTTPWELELGDRRKNRDVDSCLRKSVGYV